MDTLPNEILLSIFGHLDYQDLKVAIPLVCRQFNMIISSKSKTGFIDRRLFRDAPTSDLVLSASYQDIVLHPAFQHLGAPPKPTGSLTTTQSYAYQNIPELDAASTYMLLLYVPVYGPFGITYATINDHASTIVNDIVQSLFLNNRSLKDTSIADENATSPSTTSIMLHLSNRADGRGPVKIRGSGDYGAVTVRDVVERAIMSSARSHCTLSARITRFRNARATNTPDEYLGTDGIKADRYILIMDAVETARFEEGAITLYTCLKLENYYLNQ